MEDKNLARPLALQLKFSFNDMRRAAAMLGVTDLSDENIERLFFKREEPIVMNVREVVPNEAFEIAVAMGSMIVAVDLLQRGDIGTLEQMANDIDKITR